MMLICAAQISTIAGDIEANLRKHLTLIGLAAAHHADLICFPELSLTGYEPKLARDLATESDDARLAELQAASDADNVVICVGLPTPVATAIRISMLLFQPSRRPLTYSKQRLHADEMPYFVAGDTQLVLEAGAHRVTPAICYESLQPPHAEHAARLGGDIYLASVAKSEPGVTKANAHYPTIARQHSMTVIMANCVGPSDDFVGAGQSGVWNRRGERVGRLDCEQEGLLLFDTASGTVSTATV